MEYNLGRIGIVVNGAYNNTKTYYPLDLVTYNGGSYIAKQETKGNLPTSELYWDCIAALNIELRATGTHIQWRSNNGVWVDLVRLSDIQGPTGTSSVDTDIRTGSATLSVNPKTGGTETLTKSITFDTPRTTVPKWVSVAASSGFNGLKFWNFSTGNYSTTGFDIYLCRTETSTSTTGTVPIRYCAF